MTENLIEDWIAAARMLNAKKSPHPQHQWAFDWFLDNMASNPAEVFRQMVAIAAATDDESVLSLLGAGPLESFIDSTGSAYLVEIEKAAANLDSFAVALSSVAQGDIPDEIWSEIEAIKRRIV